ncbi:MAG TPA: hypothetical protein DFS52_00865 [Myxococcales bacterium]|jgi:hypothetical protein|nr:hypothetical protein [Myxococcales bacterium]
MGRHRTVVSLILASLVLTSARSALALERARTDGPPGSEIGAGGYVRPGGDRFSVGVDWGASLAKGDCAPPILLGLKLAYWLDDWFQVEASGTYLFENESLELLVGPRFRTSPFRRVGLSVGLKGGAILLPYREERFVYRPLFALSPQIGLDMLVRDWGVLDLTYALDLDAFRLSPAAHRLFMTLGYRF